MLEADQEYIALVSKHLKAEHMENWAKLRSTDWNTFYSFLENIAKDARVIQVLEETRNRFSAPHPPKKCKHCDGDHASRFCKKQNNKSTKVLTVGDKKMSQACDQEGHTVKLINGKTIVSNRTICCPKLKSADHAGKGEMLKQVKSKASCFCK